MKISTVVFDLGGVLLNPQPIQMLKAIAGRSGEAIALLQNRFCSVEVGDTVALWETGVLTDELALAALGKALNVDSSVIREECPGYFSCDDEMPPLVERLRKKYSLVGITNMPPLFAKNLASQFPMIQAFSDFVTSFHAKARKPDKAFFEHLCDRLTIPKQQALIVDDNPNNLTAASEFGFETLLLKNAQDLELEISRRHP